MVGVMMEVSAGRGDRNNRLGILGVYGGTS